ncbi:MAG: hypothetical protein OER88_11485, partial [Planctomycetota bacterium]|nr:hypothetical protein [Planctomycetota bacterium]
AIPKDSLRLGVLIEGPFGTGYLWHHLNCMAKRDFAKVESAYEEKAWDEGVKVPPLDSLRGLADKAEQKKKERKEAPYAELAPSGRAKCKHCGETIEKASVRFGVPRRVEFYGQTRHAVVNIHPRCVEGELDHEDSAIEPAEFKQKIRENTQGVDPAVLDAALAEVQGM